MSQVRLNKAIASLSRRAADAAIVAGRVRVDGETVTQLGTKVSKESVVTVDDKVEQVLKPIYVKFWKPLDVVSTADWRTRKNVLRAVGDLGRRVFTIGRLDKDSTGLLVLTDDGALSCALQRSDFAKRYVVDLDREPSEADVEALRAGVEIDLSEAPRPGLVRRASTYKHRRVTTRPCCVTRLGPTRLEIELTEGRNRQIRKSCATLGLDVVSLHRSTFAGLTLDGLAGPGEWAYFDPPDHWPASLGVGCPPAC